MISQVHYGLYILRNPSQVDTLGRHFSVIELRRALRGNGHIVKYIEMLLFDGHIAVAESYGSISLQTVQRRGLMCRKYQLSNCHVPPLIHSTALCGKGPIEAVTALERLVTPFSTRSRRPWPTAVLPAKSP